MEDCKHRQVLNEYAVINGVQDVDNKPSMFLVTCPDCGTTHPFRGHFEITETTRSLTDVARELAMMPNEADFGPCEVALDFLSDQAYTNTDLIFLISLRSRIQRKIAKRKVA